MSTGKSYFEVKGPVKDGTFNLRKLVAEDTLGRPFDYQLELFSDEPDVNANSVLGKAMTVSVNKPDGSPRHFNGFVSQFTNAGHFGGYQVYRVALRPWIWFLTRTSDCRIFQDMAVPDIIEKIFKEENGFSDYKRSLSQTYKTSTYCVQYRETDFDFVSRLMEHEGICYYFEHTSEKHTLVLADSANAHSPIKGSSKLPFRRPGEAYTGQEHISAWLSTQEIQTGTYALNAFDFEKPRSNLLVTSKEKRQHAQAGNARYDYPGKYLETRDGERYAAVRLAELQSCHSQIKAQGNAYELATGSTFELTEHPRSGENDEYLITSSRIEIESGEIEQFGDTENTFDVHLTAIPRKQTFRPPRTTPKPVVQGPQTAIVVGKKGEEIWTDKYGRVKVQFHWDRLGKNDENSSCWVRVAQIWAGKNWGAMHIPRIGQEVIVDFLEADPDRPVITGRVYNADHMPPYKLPDNATQSGIKSRSSKEGTKDHFNELRFEDKKDSEEIYFHAEKDFNRVVENNESLKVGSKDADEGNQTIEIWNDRTETVKEGNEKITIEKGDRDVNVDKGNDTHKIKQGHRKVEIDTGNDTLTIKQGNQTIKLNAGKSTIEAMQSIELKVASSSIKITPDGITIKAPQVTVQADIKAEIKGTMTDVKGMAMVQVQGGLVKIN